jgi:hypothetical protein
MNVPLDSFQGSGGLGKKTKIEYSTTKRLKAGLPSPRVSKQLLFKSGD